uniref:Uncharacterized protein n=1 Tax=Anguilla anguilla TaxID=7936 RepID=A0A0E9Q019_ANGAN
MSIIAFIIANILELDSQLYNYGMFLEEKMCTCLTLCLTTLAFSLLLLFSMPTCGYSSL